MWKVFFSMLSALVLTVLALLALRNLQRGEPFPHARELEIYTTQDLLNVAQSIHGPTNLTIYSQQLSDKITIPSPASGDVRKLTLVDCSVNTAYIESIAALIHLDELELKDCTAEGSLARETSEQFLSWLTIDGCDKETTDCALRRFVMARRVLLRAPPEKVSVSLNSYPDLHKLAAEHCQLTIQSKKSPVIEIVLTGVEFSSEEFSRVLSLENLQILILSSCKIRNPHQITVPSHLSLTDIHFTGDPHSRHILRGMLPDQVGMTP